MRTLKFDNLAWIRKDEHPDEVLGSLREKLTVDVLKYRGPEETVLFYQENTEWFGMPRQFALKFLPIAKYDFQDKTSRPFIQWPDVQFPEGGGYRGDQEKAVDKIYSAFESGEYGGLLNARCGAGKTLMSLAVASKLNTPTLVLAHKTDLFNQWMDHINGNPKYGIPAFFKGASIGRIQGDVLDYKGKHLVLATFQTAYSRLETLSPELRDAFGLVIVDEGHRMPARTFEAVLRESNARFRLSISATFRRKDGLDIAWKWHVGPVLASPSVETVVGRYWMREWDTLLHEEQFAGTPEFVTAIAKNRVRNLWIVSEILKAVDAGRKIILVSDRVEHCKILKEELTQAALERNKIIPSGIYAGALTEDEINRIKDKQVIFATYQKMAEGTDVKQADTLMLITPKSDIEQVVGRIQRPAQKKHLVVVYVKDSTPWCGRMASKAEEMLQHLGFTNGESNGRITE